MSQIQKILELARWAPSGDNTQPWRFKILGPKQAEVHCFDTRTHCVYDLDGHPSQIAMGALIETISIAASSMGWEMQCERITSSPESAPVFNIHFIDAPLRPCDPLHLHIASRTVQRRPLSTRRLGTSDKLTLSQSIGPQFRVHWIEGSGSKLDAALLMFKSAKIRLTIPEAYEVHKAIIDWGKKFSEDRVPDQALGTDPATTRLMRLIMKSWGRVEFFNRYCAGTWAPRIQLDFIPSIACGAHFVIYSKAPPKTIDDYVAIGRALQRFWLTATQLNLQLQPEVTPLVFARYARESRKFSQKEHASQLALSTSKLLNRLLGEEIAATAGFMGRIGFGKQATSRSLRLPLSSLSDPNL